MSPARVSWACVPSIRLVSPKSVRNALRPSISTLAGLTSRWIRPIACAASSARGDLAADVDRPVRAQAPVGAQDRGQVLALDELHREVEHPVDLAGVVDGDDVRVLERGGDPRLAREALAEALGLGEVGRDDLDGGAALEVQVLRAVDHAHAAAADPLLDPVSRDDRAEARVVARVRHHAPQYGRRRRDEAPLGGGRCRDDRGAAGRGGAHRRRADGLPGRSRRGRRAGRARPAGRGRDGRRRRRRRALPARSARARQRARGGRAGGADRARTGASTPPPRGGCARSIDRRELRARASELEAVAADLAVARRRDVDAAALDTLRRLAMAAEYRDDNTREHTERVGDLAARLARHLGQRRPHRLARAPGGAAARPRQDRDPRHRAAQAGHR